MLFYNSSLTCSWLVLLVWLQTLIIMLFVFIPFVAHVKTTINLFPPSAAYMHQWIDPTLVQILACRLFGAKPLSKPILCYCQLDPEIRTSVKSLSKYKQFCSRKCIRNYRLWNGGHFVYGEISSDSTCHALVRSYMSYMPKYHDAAFRYESTFHHILIRCLSCTSNSVANDNNWYSTEVAVIRQQRSH